MAITIRPDISKLRIFNNIPALGLLLCLWSLLRRFGVLELGPFMLATLVLTYNAFYFYSVGSNVSTFISNFNNLNFFSLLGHLAKSLSIINLVKEVYFGLTNLPIVFQSSTPFTSALIVIISFLWVVLELGCPSFSQFLKLESWVVNLSFQFEICWFLFLNISIHCCKFPSVCSAFNAIIDLRCIVFFFFICIQVLPNFSWDPSLTGCLGMWCLVSIIQDFSGFPVAMDL